MGTKELANLFLQPGSSVYGLLRGTVTRENASMKVGNLLASWVNKVVVIVDPSRIEDRLTLQVQRHAPYQGAAQYSLHLVERKTRAANFGAFFNETPINEPAA